MFILWETVTFVSKPMWLFGYPLGMNTHLKLQKLQVGLTGTQQMKHQLSPLWCAEDSYWSCQNWRKPGCALPKVTANCGRRWYHGRRRCQVPTTVPRSTRASRPETVATLAAMPRPAAVPRYAAVQHRCWTRHLRRLTPSELLQMTDTYTTRAHAETISPKSTLHLPIFDPLIFKHEFRLFLKPQIRGGSELSQNSDPKGNQDII